MKILLSVNYKSIDLENELSTFLEESGYNVIKLTNRGKTSNYVNEGLLASESVAQNDGELAIIVSSKPCGVVMAANKVRGIRCLNILNVKMAKNVKKQFNPNVIVIPASKEKEIKDFIHIFLNTEYNKEKYDHEISTLHDYEFSCLDC